MALTYAGARVRSFNNSALQYNQTDSPDMTPHQLKRGAMGQVAQIPLNLIFPEYLEPETPGSCGSSLAGQWALHSASYCVRCPDKLQSPRCNWCRRTRQPAHRFADRASAASPPYSPDPYRGSADQIRRG